MNDLKQIISDAERELELMNLHEHEFGKSFINLLKSSHSLSNGDSRLMKTFLEMPKRIVNGFPLNAIHEHEFKEDKHGIKRCVRYEYAFLDSNSNQYYDQQGIGFFNKDNPDVLIYGKNGNMNSITKIEKFPYYPKAVVREL